MMLAKLGSAQGQGFASFSAGLCYPTVLDSWYRLWCRGNEARSLGKEIGTIKEGQSEELTLRDVCIVHKLDKVHDVCIDRGT